MIWMMQTLILWVTHREVVPAVFSYVTQIFSFFCIISSWASFLIKPKVSLLTFQIKPDAERIFNVTISDRTGKNGDACHPIPFIDGSSRLNHIIFSRGDQLKSLKLHQGKCWVNRNKCCQCMGTLFKVWQMEQYIWQPQKHENLWSLCNSGVPRHIRPNLLGPCSLLLHFWCNPCLRKPTGHTQVRKLSQLPTLIGRILSHI